LLLLLFFAGCGRSTVSSEIREQAYRSNNVGVALLEQFKYPEAGDAFRAALAADNSLAIARFNLSLALFYARDLEGARREATEAARLMADAPQPHYVLGLIGYAENRTADALEEFDRVRQIDSGDVGANVNLGQMYLAEQQYAEAIRVLRQAVSDEPYNVTAAYNLGLALARSGQAEEGRQMLERAQSLRSSGYSVTYGTGYLEQGRYAEAIASTGAEPDLVETAVPTTSFTPNVLAPAEIPPPVPSPFGRGFAAGDLAGDRLREIAAGLGGGVTLVDADGDGILDAFVATPGRERLLHNNGRGTWADVSAASGLREQATRPVPIGCVAGDYDNDGRVDLFVLRYGRSSLYHNDGDGHFSDATARAGIPAFPFLPGAAAFVDVDHDGDVDLLVAGLADVAATKPAADRSLIFPRDFAPAPLRLLRNNGNGTFTDTTDAARLTARGHAVAIVPTDFDNRRDIDLLIVNRDTPPNLFQNRRDGTFRDVAAETGLAAAVNAAGEITAAAAADVNKDDYPDFFFATTSGAVFALSDGRGRFRATAAPDGARGALAAQLFDYDNDGLIDLLTWSGDRPRLFRNLGQRWTEVTDTATPRGSSGLAVPASARGVSVADLNADGSEDFVTVGTGQFAFWPSSGTPGRRSQRVVLKGRVSNRSGAGTKVQIRAGSLSARAETSAATPAVAPSDVVFGLGARSGTDVVRVLWPSGILQAEAATAGATLPSPLIVEELDRKPSSCPFLFTWNGERFEFVTDFMGAGEMGYWEAPAKYNTPDPLEYVRIRGDQLRPKDGRFEIRVTNELEETLFADRLQLIAIAHPQNIAVYPNEGMTDPPKPFRLFAVANPRVPRAIDDHGHDVTERIARDDGKYPDDFPLERFRGYAASHTLTLDLAPVVDRPVLLLTAWTDYAFSSDNVAAHQAGLSLRAPSLQIKDATGRWRTEIDDIGIPVGRPQTIPIDLAGRLHRGEHEVRIVTNMRIYWDSVRVATGMPGARLETLALDPIEATLKERGFSGENHAPIGYDYSRVSTTSPWKTMAGRYTRLGDVRDLLMTADDMFVIAKPGDEIAVAFDAGRLSPLPDGWTRTFLLLGDGFSKEMDINSASPDRVGPLPFHAMSRYPYGEAEHYPETPEHSRYEAGRNTRTVVKPVPLLPVEATR